MGRKSLPTPPPATTIRRTEPTMADLAILQAFERYGALGPDFLTWLFARVVRTEPPECPLDALLEIDIHGPLVLEAAGGEATRVALAGEEAATAPEVRSALREGKRLVRAKLIFKSGTDEFQFTLDATTFDLRGLKVNVPKSADANQVLADRVAAMQRVFDLIDSLFEVFLPLRLDKAVWQEETERWRE